MVVRLQGGAVLNLWGREWEGGHFSFKGFAVRAMEKEGSCLWRLQCGYRHTLEIMAGLVSDHCNKGSYQNRVSRNLFTGVYEGVSCL